MFSKFLLKRVEKFLLLFVKVLCVSSSLRELSNLAEHLFGEEKIEHLLIGSLRLSLIRSLLFLDFLTFYMITEDDSRIFDDFAFCDLSCNGNKLSLSLSLSYVFKFH